MKTPAQAILSFLICSLMIIDLSAQKSYHSFELRQFSSDPAANGETDFKGPTAIFDTKQRVDYLRRYAEVSRRFFEDAELAKQVVTDQEATNVAAKIKAQPLPQIRKQIPLVDWKYYGYRSGQEQESRHQLAIYQQNKHAKIIDGALEIQNDHRGHTWNFTGQAWRSSISWRVYPMPGGATSILFSELGKIPAARISFSDGRLSYTTAGHQEVEVEGAFPLERWYDCKIEFDLAAFKRKQDVVRYNLYVNDQLVADYVPLERVVMGGVGYAQNFTTIAKINQMDFTGPKGSLIDELWGVGYTPSGRESYPYTIETFLDEDFEARPGIDGWHTAGYSDTSWHTGSLPIAHGSERHQLEELYLRKEIRVGAFKKAYLQVETLDPSGELYVNGQLVSRLGNRHDAEIDLTDYLIPNATNLLAVKVDHFYLTERVGELMPHSSLDFNIGWFAGRMTLDLVERTHISDVFAYTEQLDRQRADIRVKASIRNTDFTAFRGKVRLSLAPWFPQEGVPVATQEYEILTGQLDTFSLLLPVNNPKLWTPETPALYQLTATLLDRQGVAVDDYVITTGIRTVDQIGGQFRLNGKVSMLNGAQTFGFRAPVEDMIKNQRCAPAHWVAKELLQIKRMNGNLLRTHVHAWEFPARGTNDPRYAEYADQLGIMILWCPTSWIRTGRGWNDIDFVGLPKNIRQVRNHPSIVMWEAANHTQSFKDHPVSESNKYCETVYRTVHPIDPSRIISYNSFIRHLHYGNDAGTIDQEGNTITPSWAWTAPGVTRGNQDSPTGYGKEWSILRQWPGDYRQDFLDSKDRAYFNFEHQESIGQPNWNSCRGKPWYRLHSYEWSYDEGSIGRRLSLDEWAESQAWQGFSAWEAIKKMRWLGYDGFSWCCLHGGPNSVTYKKPLIDFLGNAKIAWYTNKMAFQGSVAGSYDVDIVYGPEDEIRPVVIHWGDSGPASLKVKLLNEVEEVVAEKSYTGIVLPTGRETVELDAWRPSVQEEGLYVIEYHLQVE
jgi:hypothetical protein